MGTRSRIARRNADGSWTSIYCHWDGYIAHNGAILQEHYTDPAKVDALLALGDLSILRAKIGTKHPFADALEDECTAYGRDRDETETTAVTSATATDLAALSDAVNAEFLYFFADGTWYVSCADGVRFAWSTGPNNWGDGQLLADAIPQLPKKRPT